MKQAGLEADRQVQAFAGPGFEVPEPKSIEETGLPITLLSDLVLKALYYHSLMSGRNIADLLRLPYYGIVDQVIEFLRREELCDLAGSEGLGDRSHQFMLTPKGLVRARDALERSAYSGPAPVTLDAYNAVVSAQTINNIRVHFSDVRWCLSHLVMDDDTLDAIGLAVNAGRSIFLYGPPGNGKTSLAEGIARMLGGDILIPYCMEVDGHIIKVLDPHNHQPVADDFDLDVAVDGDARDRRWVLCKRPRVIVGGELTMANLDLIHDDASGIYEAPFQVKANGGMFLIDDFGRQVMRPQDLLNRWIVPLEKGVDYLTLRTGKKIEVQFDQITVFSTNLDPADLVDEAFLRRIQNKILVDNPTWDQYREIFKEMCKQFSVPFSDEGLVYLIKEHYMKAKRDPRSCHPRDLLKQLTSIARYRELKPALSPDLLDRACKTYFVKL